MESPCAWAMAYPRLLKACQRYDICLYNAPTRFAFSDHPTILQTGPQCGLVTLAMCMAKGSPCDEKLCVEKLFKQAKDAEYTKNGEMFSARHLADLARANLAKRRVELYNGTLADARIEEFLFGNGIMLVPYDSDANHSPCKKKGHKAHWALITGVIEDDGQLFVVAQHGKTIHHNIWDLQDLSDSNGQLEEFSPARKLSASVTYVLPEGGLSGPLGLKNKAVLIYPDSKTSLKHTF